MWGENPSPQLLLFGLFFSIYFPMRATNSLMRAVRTAYHLGPPRRIFVHLFKSLLYTALLIATIALTLAMMTVGDRLLAYAVSNLHLPRVAAELWGRLRFPVAAPRAFSPCCAYTPLRRMADSPGGICGRERCFPWRHGWRFRSYTPCMWTILPTIPCCTAPLEP